MLQAEKPYGRNRESLADLTVKLEDLFRSQPGVKEQDNGELVLPIRGVTQVLKVFFHENGLDQLSEEDESQFSTIIESNPELELTPTHLLAFVAQLTAANSPPPTPPIKDGSDEDEDDYTLHGRGRASHKLSSAIDSRSSSSDSVGTSRYDRPDKARPPRRIPNSPFENRNRQPRGIADPPSSWSGKRPIPPSKRRRSDAGSNYGSDNEVSICIWILFIILFTHLLESRRLYEESKGICISSQSRFSDWKVWIFWNGYSSKKTRVCTSREGGTS